MIVIKYQKQMQARFISHIDMLRQMARIDLRAGLECKFSKGFNPHPVIFFSPPSVLGAGSLAEYVAFDSDIDKEEALMRYNRSVPLGFMAQRSFRMEKNPNLQAKVVYADFVFDTPFIDLDLSQEMLVTYTKKGQSKTEDIAPKIAKCYPVDGKLALRLAAGNSSLRPDRVVQYLVEKYGLDLILTDVNKIDQYVLGENGEIVNVDDFLQSLSI